MSTAANVALGAICVVIVLAGLRLVTTDNIVHAALALMIVLAGTAAVFMLFGAEFLGWTQVLVYIGAIVVLFMFGVMLTKAKLGEADDIDAPRAQRMIAAGVTVLIFALLTIVFVNVYGDADLQIMDNPDVPAAENTENVLAEPTTSAEIGNDLFENWVLPFEAVSVVLLAALIGAVVLTRRDDPDHVLERSSEEMRMNIAIPLTLGAFLFCLGIYGVLSRRNAILLLMSVELMLNAVNINFVVFGIELTNITGQIFALFVIAVAAAEVGIGLAIVLLIYRNRVSVNVDEVDLMKG